MDKFIMSKKELEQKSVFEKLQNRQIKQKEAAKMLDISPRWVRTKFKRYMQFGIKGLIHQSRGKTSPKKWSEEERVLAINLLQGDWKGFGPTFAAEKLASEYKITVSTECLRKAMICEGLWTKKRQRSQHRKRRDRYVTIGLLVQFDGSPHDWFEGRGSWCTLLVFIDDATSQIMWLEFAKSESTESAMKALKNYLLKHGRPCALYTDFGSVFSINTNNPERDKITQFGRAVAELGIEMVFAHSPQAKGRVERANKTLQDRLVKEMRLAGISSIEAANKFLHESNFIEQHNQQFAQPPAQEGDAHRSLDGHDLDKILCIKEMRIMANDYTISYNSRILQIENNRGVIVRPKNKILVQESLDGLLSLYTESMRVQLKFTELAPRQKTRVFAVDFVNLTQEGDVNCSIPVQQPFFGEKNVDVHGLGTF